MSARSCKHYSIAFPVCYTEIYSKICSSASKDFSLIIRLLLLLLLLPPPICSRGKWQKHLIVVRESSQEDKKKKFMWLMCCLTCQIFMWLICSRTCQNFMWLMCSLTCQIGWYSPLAGTRQHVNLEPNCLWITLGLVEVLFEESRLHLIISLLSLEIGNIWVCMFP